MANEIRILSLHEPEAWREAHAVDGRPTQSWDYASAIAADGAVPSLAVVNAGGARLCFCFLERTWRGTTDVATVLGLSGASMAGASEAPWAAWRMFASERGWVAGYLQLADDIEALPHGEHDAVVTGNAVFLLDLDGADPIRGASEIIRRKVRRAQLRGARPVDDPDALATALARWYPETMQRLGAGPAYRHSPGTLDALARLPGAVVVGAELDGRVEAVSVFARAGGRAEFLCNGCSEAGRELSAWLIAQAIERLRALGVRELNLGGGVAPDDGLYRFKERFHGRARPLRSLRQVYAPERYAMLCAQSVVAPAGNRFPAYREV